MKSGARFKDEQIFRILQETDRDPISAVAKRHGVSEASVVPPVNRTFVK